MDFAETLRFRATCLRLIRAFFDARGFCEVTTPALIAAPAPELHILCPTASGGFLRASPELQMKKILAAGVDRIYQIGPCFREGEKGTRHNPEFTMMEWYRLNADYTDIRRDLEELLLFLCDSLSLERPACRVQTVRETYLKEARWDPWVGAFDHDRFDFDMAATIEPSFADDAVFLTDYPVAAASLARTRGDVAERWEFYWKGMELANCFSELCDASEQRRRFERARAERAEAGESDYPLDEEFLSLLPLIPSAAGVALGIDRLVAALAGARDIHDVMVS